MADSYDVIVMGSGPGGYVCAIRCAQLGLKTAVVERRHLGGVCLNWGCIPTKALLRSAEVYRTVGEAARFGVVTAGPPSVALPAMVKRSRTVAGQLNGGVAGLLRKNKVRVLSGSARLEGDGRVAVQGQDAGRYQARHIVIATGARPRVLPGIEPDGRQIWTYADAMVPEDLPASLLIIGSGAIGVEFASFYRTLGVAVTLVELLPEILPAKDPEIAALARKRFEAQGIRVLTGTRVEAVRKETGAVTATLVAQDGAVEAVTVERVISAVGVVGNVADLGIEALGVAVERGVIRTDGLGRTGVPGVYAVGDVAGPPMLAHKASHEGILCVEAIAGHAVSPLDRSRIPGCTYGHPQIASVGLSEPAARAAGRAVRIGRFPFAGNGKAIALGEAEGLVKTVFDAGTGALLGAHLIGAEVTELIHGFAIALACEATEEELMHTIFPHPTLSEALHESVLNAYGRTIHY